MTGARKSLGIVGERQVLQKTSTEGRRQPKNVEVVKKASRKAPLTFYQVAVLRRWLCCARGLKKLPRALRQGSQGED